MIIISITPKRIHITRNADTFKPSGKTYSNVSQANQNRIFELATRKATNSRRALNGARIYYIEE